MSLFLVSLHDDVAEGGASVHERLGPATASDRDAGLIRGWAAPQLGEHYALLQAPSPTTLMAYLGRSGFSLQAGREVGDGARTAFDGLGPSEVGMALFAASGLPVADINNPGVFCSSPCPGVWHPEGEHVV